MIVHELPQLPEDSGVDAYVLIPLPQIELQRLIDKNVDEVWYWFCTDNDGSYEGELIARQGNKYRYFCLTRYEDEPIIEFSTYFKWSSFMTLYNSFEFRNDVTCLLDCIKAKYSKVSFNRKTLFIKR